MQEVRALEDLSTALYDLIRIQALNYMKWAILKRTVMSTLMAGLSPLLLLKIGQVVGMFRALHAMISLIHCIR